MNFILNGRVLKYVNEDCILIKLGDEWRYGIHNINGYKSISLNKKQIYIHRILGYLFLGLDIENKEKQIDHIDGNKQNNKIENLRIVSNQQNQFNEIKAKGYSFDKRNNKYSSQIYINRKKIHLGYYNSKEEAHQAYLDAKKIYHVI